MNEKAGSLCTRLAGDLGQAGLENPRLEAEELAAHVLHKDRLFLKVHPEYGVSEEELGRLEALVQRRSQGEPLAYLTGRREFYDRTFLVEPGVLIPRPETELLIDAVLDMSRDLHGQDKPLVFCDMAAGSGCIGITLKLEQPSWQGILVERMPVPLACANKNAQSLGAEVSLLQGDLFAPPLEERSLDILVSNPPYIGRKELSDVAGDVLAYEPHEALFADKDGMAALLAVARTGSKLLKKGGILAMEHGWMQGEAVRRMLKECGYSNFFTKKDLAGLDRVGIACL